MVIVERKGGPSMCSAITRRSGLSLVEVLIAAVIIGVSAIPVLELVRSGTAQLEVSEIEAASRQLGADVLERIAGPSLGDKEKGLSAKFVSTMKGDLRWDEVIKEDPSLARNFPFDGIRSLLDLAEVRVAVEKKSPVEHPALGPAKQLEAYIVKVSWKDRNEERKEVTYARLVDL